MKEPTLKLRSMGIILEANKHKVASDKLTEVLRRAFYLSTVPSISTIDDQRFQVQLAGEEEAEKILLLVKIKIDDIEYTISKWKPSSQSEEPEWLKQRWRWVRFYGIPSHL